MIGVWEGSILTEGENEQVDASRPDWPDSYRERVVLPWLEAVRARGTSVVWVGMTRVADPLRSLGFGELSAVYRQATDQVPGTDFVDAGALLAGPDGRFRPSITTPAGAVLRADRGRRPAPLPGGGGRSSPTPSWPPPTSRCRERADPDWRATDWTRHDQVMGRRWYDARRCG